MAQAGRSARCPAGIFSVGGRLKVQIGFHLAGGPKRFGELHRAIPDTSRQMLTMSLRELEEMGLLHREVYDQAPPKVEYSLTELGRDLAPMFTQLNAWGERMGMGF